MSERRKHGGTLWMHFEKNALTKKGKCHLCQETISYKSFTNLRNHLKRKHAGVLDIFRNDKNQEIEHEGHYLNSRQNLPSTSDIGPTDSGYPKSQNIHYHNEISENITNEEKNKIDQDLLDLCIDSFHPFSIVEERGFQKFSSWIPGYTLPTKKTLNSLLDETYINVEQKLKCEVINDVNSICLSADVYTTKVTGSFIAVTGHYLTNDIQFKTIFLGFCNYSNNTASELRDIADQWGIEGKINFLVSNDEGMVVKDVKESLGFDHFECFAHTLNIIVDEALNPCKEQIYKVKKIVNYYKKSNALTELLIKYQLHQNAQPKRLIQDVTTNWISIFHMLSRFLELKEAINSTTPSSDCNISKLTEMDWSILSQLIIVLRPLEQLTKAISGEKYLTASSVIAMTRCLNEALNATTGKIDKQPVIDIVVLLKNGLSKRLQNVERDEVLSLCTLMDPRFKMQAFSDQTEALNTKERVKSLVAKIIAEERTEESTMDSEPEPKPHDDISPWAIFDKFLGKTEQNTPLTRATKEVGMYLSDEMLPRINSSGKWNCPLEWWKTHRAVYPHLTELYIRNCNIVASSVPCERLFSKPGSMVYQRKTKISSSKVKKIMFLNVNMAEEWFQNSS